MVLSSLGSLLKSAESITDSGSTLKSVGEAHGVIEKQNNFVEIAGLFLVGELSDKSENSGEVASIIHNISSEVMSEINFNIIQNIVGWRDCVRIENEKIVVNDTCR